MDRNIITVLGPVASDQLGMTDAHSHLWISSGNLQLDNAPVLDQFGQIAQDLVAYKENGGRTQLDCQPGGAGRDGNQLRLLSKSTGIQVIACTGFHLKQYYADPHKIWKMNVDQAVDYFLGEVNQGLEETRDLNPVYPGFIKIAVNSSLEDSPKELMEAAVITSKRTGLLIEMHTDKGSGVEDFVDHFGRLDLSPNRLVFCHIDKRPDIGLHKELCQAGFLLEYDTFFRPKYKPENNVWPLIENLIEGGYLGSIALATDLADSQMWNSMGNGPGLMGFPTIIKDRLEKINQDPQIIEKLMGGNIANRLVKKEGEQ